MDEPSLLTWCPLYLRSVGVNKLSLSPGQQPCPYFEVRYEHNSTSSFHLNLLLRQKLAEISRLTFGGACNGCSTSTMTLPKPHSHWSMSFQLFRLRCIINGINLSSPPVLMLIRKAEDLCRSGHSLWRVIRVRKLRRPSKMVATELS